jgi:hypothetical protein
VRRFALPRGRWFALGAIVGAALAAGAVAVAAIPDSAGAIHGCYQKNVGNLRVIEPSAGDSCRPSEVEISWSQTGPKGAQGLKGDTGGQGLQGLKGDTGGQGLQGLKGDRGETGGQGLKGDAGQAGAAGAQGPTGATGPAGPAGPPGISGPQSCAPGQSMTGIDGSGSIICSGCPSATFHFRIRSVPNTTTEFWQGGTQTQSNGPGCSVTVRAPHGDISLVGGTTGADAWQIVSKDGFTSANGTALTPECGGFAAVASVGSDRPTCSNASTILERDSSAAEFVVTAN